MTIWPGARSWSSRPDGRPAASTSRSRPTCSTRARINVFERWDSQDAVEAFRGSGPGDEQAAMIVSASVSEFDVSGERRLT